MRFEPKTDEQLDMEGLLPAGRYPFDVFSAEDTYSKTSGAPMLKVVLAVHGDQDVKVTLYIVESQMRRLKDLCDALGLSAVYESGNVEATDLLGYDGEADFRIVPAKDGYRAKLEVDRFLKPGVTSSSVRKPERNKAPAMAGAEDDDEIPF